MKKFESNDAAFECLLSKLDRAYGHVVRDTKMLKELLSKTSDNQLDDFIFTSQVGLLHARQKEYDNLMYLVRELVEVTFRKNETRKIELYRDSEDKHYLVELDE